jgi:hypothetical protein
MKKTSISLMVTCLAMSASSLFAQTSGGSSGAGAGSGPSTAGPSTPATPAIPGISSTDPGQSGIGTSGSGVVGRDLKDNPRVSTSGSASQSVAPGTGGQISSGTNFLSGSSRAGDLSKSNPRRIKGTATGIDTRGQGAATVSTKGSTSTAPSTAPQPLNSSDDWKRGADAGIPTPTTTAGLGTNSINNSSGIGAGLNGGEGVTVTNGNINSTGVASGSVGSGTPITEASGTAGEPGGTPDSGSRATPGAGK